MSEKIPTRWVALKGDEPTNGIIMISELLARPHAQTREEAYWRFRAEHGSAPTGLCAVDLNLESVKYVEGEGLWGVMP